MTFGKLWHMNADFELELSHPAGRYRRLPPAAQLNCRLAPHLLWLARPGDALLVEEPWPAALRAAAHKRGVELIPPTDAGHTDGRVFTPWGWTPSAVELGQRIGATLPADRAPLETVARVNSKLWSHALEVECGLALPGARVADSFEDLRAAVARGAPAPQDKWVIKSPFGFAARERVLGRGPALEGPPATWCRRRLARGETLIFQPWLDVTREYGTVVEIDRGGSYEIRGYSDLQTNGAGTGRGYLLGRPPAPARQAQLEEVAALVSGRLFAEGYYGPVGIDSLEHANGFHPILEINARYTMGFVALAVERESNPTAPIFWSTK